MMHRFCRLAVKSRLSETSTGRLQRSIIFYEKNKRISDRQREKAGKKGILLYDNADGRNFGHVHRPDDGVGGAQK